MHPLPDCWVPQVRLQRRVLLGNVASSPIPTVPGDAHPAPSIHGSVAKDHGCTHVSNVGTQGSASLATVGADTSISRTE